MNIQRNLEVDEEARRQIEKCYLEPRVLEERVSSASLYYLAKATDPAGNPIRSIKHGYQLVRMRVEDLEGAQIFEVSGDGVYLAVLFKETYDPNAQYILECFDGVFYLLKQHQSLEDEDLREALFR